MNIVEFLGTIYLGDRALKSILIDGWRAEVKLQVSCISRIRSDSWNFYTDEDLPEGCLVFQGVTRVIHDASGFVPNDVINEIRAEAIDWVAGVFLISVNADSVDDKGDRTEVWMKIYANSMVLEAGDGSGRRIAV